jgi:hypothetical protein
MALFDLADQPLLRRPGRRGERSADQGRLSGSSEQLLEPGAAPGGLAA